MGNKVSKTQGVWHKCGSKWIFKAKGGRSVTQLLQSDEARFYIEDGVLQLFCTIRGVDEAVEPIATSVKRKLNSILGCSKSIFVVADYDGVHVTQYTAKFSELPSESRVNEAYSYLMTPSNFQTN